MEEQNGLQLPGSAEDDVRRFREWAWPSNVLDDPRVENWRKAKRITLAALLGFSLLHYYFLDVQLTIMALPHAGVVVPPHPPPGTFNAGPFRI